MATLRWEGWQPSLRSVVPILLLWLSDWLAGELDWIHQAGTILSRGRQFLLRHIRRLVRHAGAAGIFVGG